MAAVLRKRARLVFFLLHTTSTIHTMKATTSTDTPTPMPILAEGSLLWGAKRERFHLMSTFTQYIDNTEDHYTTSIVSDGCSYPRQPFLLPIFQYNRNVVLKQIDFRIVK